MKNVIYFFMIMVIFAILGVVGGILGSELNRQFNIVDEIFYDKSIGIEGLNTTTVKGIISSCDSNETRLDKELECVMKHVDRFYSYVPRPDNETISFSTLMNEGGDCANWSDFWAYIGEGLGHDYKFVLINVDKSTAHRFVVITNKQGYCTVDQTDLKCFIYG